MGVGAKYFSGFTAFVLSFVDHCNSAVYSMFFKMMAETFLAFDIC